MSIEKLIHDELRDGIAGWQIGEVDEGIPYFAACEIADVIGPKVIDLIREAMTGDEAMEAAAEALPDLHWCESNYTRGCNCLDERKYQARAVLDAVATTLGGDQ